ncbi:MULTISPECIES: cytidine deaminase [Vibrio]|uniref:Cytidine deaminase n=2 Tax=Vibrio TaxID=662 RepID=A0A7X4RVK7_9VIBR|nr:MULTISPECIES: cytidine deaminase [Vibrio]MBF9000132.1 cytidine deaminase [Vibrio nitrifigilis]MZI94375.1 cytidine deaminase [Vibrio eleionomae]
MKGRIEEALKTLPEAISDYLSPIVLADDFDATLSAEHFTQLLTLSGYSDAELRIALLPLAAAFAYVPISNFYVGAIVRGLSGRIYFGANMEFSGAQLGQTIHAEQAGISHAWTKGEEGIKDLTVNHTPCGHCRQFMNELTTADSLQIQLPARDSQSLQHYLPESFGPKDLGIESALMAKIDNGQHCDVDEAIVQHALSALNRSHAPYTHNLSGVALQTRSGRYYTGAYAENAAFNPSLPPLQVALVLVRMGGEEFTAIEHAALVEMAQGTISHLACTQSTLEAINPDIDLAYLALD